MAFGIDPCTFEFLSVAKDLYDHDLLDKVLETFGNMEVCEDCYSIAWEGIANVFSYFRQYYNDKCALETMVFCDPVITNFYRLCVMYEAQKDIAKKDDSFRQDAEREVYQCFCLDAFDFDVLLFDGSHGSPRMVVLAGEEFYGHTELPGVLADVRDTYKRYCDRLREKLVVKNDIAVSENIDKEAA